MEDQHEIAFGASGGRYMQVFIQQPSRGDLGFYPLNKQSRELRLRLYLPCHLPRFHIVYASSTKSTVQRSLALLLLQVQEGKSVWRAYALANTYGMGSRHSASSLPLSLLSLFCSVYRSIWIEPCRCRCCFGPHTTHCSMSAKIWGTVFTQLVVSRSGSCIMQPRIHAAARRRVVGRSY